MLSGASEILERYFDYEAFGRDLFLESYTEISGFVFVDWQTSQTLRALAINVSTLKVTDSTHCKQFRTLKTIATIIATK